MGNALSDLLTIELGAGCNNRCAFCPQHHLRVCGLPTVELSTAQVLRRLQEGRREGFARIAFTGGEPTVRSDLVALVAAATRLGYVEIGMTTNGRLLSALGLADELVAAGLNHLSFSLHSALAANHDRLSGVAGAHGQLLVGIAALRAAAQARSRLLRLHSISLLLPETIAEVEQTVAAAAGMGATIHILQPFIASRANLHLARHFTVQPAELARAVERAGRQALALGTRVKPYNLAPCLLASLEGIELQEYGLVTRRRQGQPAEAGGQRQFFRELRCTTCATPCPGFRVEHYPREKMARIIAQAVRDERSAVVALPGLDLLPAAELGWLLRELRGAGKDCRPMVGGPMWSGPEEFVAAAREGGVSRVYHLLRTEWRGSDGREGEPGNEGELIHLAGLLLREGIPSSLFVATPELESLDLSVSALTDSFTELHLAVPRRWRGGLQGQALARQLVGRQERTAALAERLALSLPVRLATFDATRALGPELSRYQQLLAARLPSEEWSTRLLRHEFTSPQLNFIQWSFPFWLY